MTRSAIKLIEREREETHIYRYVARRVVVIGFRCCVTALSASPALAKTRTFTKCQDLTCRCPSIRSKVSFTVSTPKNAKPKGAKVTDVNAGVRITHTYD